ncbi:MAG: PQQ-dependent sugar dehydrogenase, partial [Ginsengibacter sp.]
RLFIADRAGRIRIIDADGTLRPTPFLNITSKISSASGEEGFLGIAFSPTYKSDGKFYVDYTSNIAGKLTTVIEQYNVSAADSNVADPNSALTLLTQVQPYTNHNGGNLMFGKDGYLYINLGDGGSGGDPYGNGQNKNVFLGKILRIDVSNSSASQPYVVPPTNPFYSDATGVKKEIWAYGVRNPWKSSVDRITGDLWIADVGQDAVEEIDYQPANAAGGRNYGWNITEGNSCYSPSTGCNKTGITLPIYDYPHPVGNSITGGYIYRSAQSKALFGTYIFGDYVAKWIDGIKQSGGVLDGTVTHFITATQSGGNPISFGEDIYGDQYVIFNSNGTIYQLQDTSYLRRPKAYFTPGDAGAGSFLLEGLQGKNLTYQWLKDNMAISGATSPDYTTSALGSYTLEVTNTLGFKDTSDVFILGSSVNLTSFTAQKIPGGLVRLDWQTTAELNITGFTVQRRKDNETSFSDIGFVDSKSINGFSNSELDYTFTDSSASGFTKLFYRIKIAYADGSFNYSDVRFITSDATKNGYLIFPNPATGHIQIYLNQFTQPVTMILYDNAGRKIEEQVINQQNVIVELPASRGIYIVQISNTNGDNKVRKKIIAL